jgi:hypothetical protein
LGCIKRWIKRLKSNQQPIDGEDWGDDVEEEEKVPDNDLEEQADNS